MNKARMKVLVILLVIAITVSGTIVASAGTKLYFSVKGTQTQNTNTVTTGASKFKYILNFTNVATDNVPADSYYLNVKLQKRNIGVVYVTKNNTNYYGPVTGSKVTADFGTGVKNMTIRYKVENSGALLMAGYFDNISYE